MQSISRTIAKQSVQQKVVTISPSATVLCTSTIGKAEVTTRTVSSITVVTVESAAAATTSAPKLGKRAQIAIPAYASSVCSGNVAARFLSACSCVVKELNTGAVLPAVAAKTVTVTNVDTVTKYHTLPPPTSTIVVTPSPVVSTVTELSKATQIARPYDKSFKIKFKGGMHDGRYLFSGPVFDEQPGIYYSMFTPNRGDAMDFKLNKDGVISSVKGNMNLTYSSDFDDDSRYPPEKEGDPPITVPSFVFLMEDTTQAIPDYNSSPIKCKLVGDDNLACTAGDQNQRTETGWYAFGIDETNYIPTLGLGKPGYDWMYWPGQKVVLVADYS
ncbi:hypothetical protein TWF481_002088 [Arthrobotrys musiformis]|uniref:Uncharacterized protein n=1 Tax=Arthrobotrys musiformis TaxID=47236 RepID=A0AAV9VUC7_9PEZI